MRFPLLAALAVLPVAAVAEPLGTVTFVTGGQSYDFVVPEGSGGTLTYWDVGPVEIHAWHADGTILSLSFQESDGEVRIPGFGFLEPGGRAWRNEYGSFSIRLTRAENRPPNYLVAGTFAGPVVADDGTRSEISGRFTVTLPRRDFAPTPPD